MVLISQWALEITIPTHGALPIDRIQTPSRPISICSHLDSDVLSPYPHDTAEPIPDPLGFYCTDGNNQTTPKETDPASH